MGPDLSTSGTRTACPSCRARLRPDATFCGQCYADFRPPPSPPVVPAAVPLVPAPTAAYGTPAPDPLTAPLLDIVLPSPGVPVQAGHVPAPAAEKPTGWPCWRCEAVNDFTDTLCTGCGSAFLAEVAEQTKVTLVLPVVGDISRYSRGQRAALAFAAILAVLIPLAVITLLLTHSPSPSGKPAGGGSSSTTTTTVTTTGNG